MPLGKNYIGIGCGNGNLYIPETDEERMEAIKESFKRIDKFLEKARATPISIIAGICARPNLL